MSFVSQGVAVVTGAGSGIGRALALQLTAAGSAVALADVDEAGLIETASLIGGKQAAATTHVVDVADEAAMRKFANDVMARHGRVTLVINNAGVAVYGNFEEIALDDFRWLMGINFWGTVYGTRLFLPVLRRQPRGHIVNISSVFGMIAPAGQCAYATSKFAVRGFSEAVRHELAGSNVGLSVVHPAGVKTAIARRGRLPAGLAESRKAEGIASLDRLSKTTPDQAAERILRGVEKKEPRILIGSDARVIDVMQRLKPASYWNLMARGYNLKL